MWSLYALSISPPKRLPLEASKSWEGIYRECSSSPKLTDEEPENLRDEDFLAGVDGLYLRGPPRVGILSASVVSAPGSCVFLFLRAGHSVQFFILSLPRAELAFESQFIFHSLLVSYFIS